MRWLALTLFLALPAHAQVVQIQGGSSTLYQADGAGAVLHFPNQTATFGAGTVGGQFHFGLSDSFTFHGWDTTVGDRYFGFVAGGAGIGIGTRGLSLGKRHGGTTWAVFAGTTGTQYGAPYFTATSTQHFGAGIAYRRAWRGGLEFSSLEVLAGAQRSAIESLGYHGRWIQAQGAGGVLQNARYWNAEVDLKPVRWLGFNATRTTYSFATVNSAGAFAVAGPLNFHASAFQSHDSGGTVGTGARLGFLEVRVDHFQSRNASNNTAIVSERIGRRWRVEQDVSESQGHLSFSAGGGYTSNRFSLDVTHQTFWMPLRGEFQQAAAITFSIHLPHDSAATVSTSLDPTGKLRYAAYGSTWAYGKNLSNDSRQRPVVRGGLIIKGIVVDKSGMPVDGAAVSVGGQLAYTNSAGAWFVRLRRARPATVRLEPVEFSAPGEWVAQTGPVSVVPQPDSAAQPVTLVAARAGYHP